MRYHKPLMFMLSLVILMILSPLLSPLLAQQAKSNCVVTKVGNPAGTPVLPADCEAGISGGFQKCTEATYLDLAKKILAHENFKETWPVPNKEADIMGHLTKCNTLAVIASLLTLGVPVEVSSLVSDHPKDGTLHTKGLGIDIYTFSPDPKGVKMYEYLYKNREELGVVQLIWAYPPPISGISSGTACLGQKSNANMNVPGIPVNCDAYYTYGVMQAHRNHIHIGVVDK